MLGLKPFVRINQVLAIDKWSLRRVRLYVLFFFTGACLLFKMHPCSIRPSHQLSFVNTDISLRYFTYCLMFTPKQFNSTKYTIYKSFIHLYWIFLRISNLCQFIKCYGMTKPLTTEVIMLPCILCTMTCYRVGTETKSTHLFL